MDMGKVYRGRVGDMRSTRGIMARGRNIYNGGSYSSHSNNLSKAAKKRLVKKPPVDPNVLRRLAVKRAVGK